MKDAFFNEDGYKKYIFVFMGLLLIFVFIIIFVFTKSRGEYLIINESSIIEKSGSKYKQVSSFDDKILDNSFSVYSDGELYKDLTVKRESNFWYYFDKDYNDLELKKVSLAYTKGYSDLKIADYNVSYYEDEDNDVLKKVLGDRKIADYKDSVIKSFYDLDNDGVLETIYTVSSFDMSGDDCYSAIFLVKNGELLEVLDYDYRNSFLVQGIIDIEGDGKYEVLVSKGTSDVVYFDTCMQIYSINVKRNRRILDCK